MKIIIKTTILTLFLAISVSAAREVILQGKSDSGKTVKLNIGSLGGLVVDDTAEIAKIGGSLEVPKFEKVSSGKVLKVFPSFSYWHFPDADKENFVEGQKYSLNLRRETIAGREGVTPSYKVKSFENAKAKQALTKSQVSKLPQDLVMKNDVEQTRIYDLEDPDNKVGLNIKEISLRNKSDILLDDDYEEVKFLRADEAEIDIKQKTGEYKQKIAKEQNKAQLKSITSKEYGYEQLYYNGVRVRKPSDAPSSIANMSNEYYEEITKKSDIPESTKIMIKENGPLWSADMGKEELQTYLLKTGIAREKVRRENSMLFKSGNEVTLFLGSNLTSNYTNEDPSHQSNGFTLGLAYELHLVRASESFSRLSIDMLIEQGTLNVDVGGINGRVTYGALAGHLNYYFYNYPHSRNRVSMYVGAGIKRGNGDMTSINLTKDYEYEVLALPSLHFGAKYRAPAARDYELYSSLGFGFNFKVSVETTKLQAISSLDDEISSSTTINNVKADIGLSFFF
ncbi:hypothetical protein [Bacteriovorax sp. Seq25_V]|uniref:hypothetical protein n=1 Tax=Bacteriovorax sp. Seq25_V TaxID=1201288 RepID=UPI0012FA9752|nr:hypothetical protein [Bacteriovorax sp. Seq25_V]